jgi:hypothetical protein
MTVRTSHAWSVMRVVALIWISKLLISRQNRERGSFLRQAPGQNYCLRESTSVRSKGYQHLQALLLDYLQSRILFFISDHQCPNWKKTKSDSWIKFRSAAVDILCVTETTGMLCCTDLKNRWGAVDTTHAGFGHSRYKPCCSVYGPQVTVQLDQALWLCGAI